MKKMKKLSTSILTMILSLPFMLFAQEEGGTYIEDLNVQDSSYMEQDLLAGAETASSGNNTVIIIIVVVVVIAAVAFFMMKKKKKK
jgi:LPXTG-motif cell wall-anchored protein